MKLPPNRPIPLSDTQLEIVRLIAAGLSNREIAERVHLSQNTVKSHVQEVFRKLDVGNRVEAALMATRKGWICSPRTSSSRAGLGLRSCIGSVRRRRALSGWATPL